MNDNEIKELMKKARVHNRAGYDQIHALRFLITFKRSKDKFSEAEFRSIAAAKGVQLGGYKDMQALINQGRDIYRRLELITDRDLTEEIAPLQILEEPTLFPEVPEEPAQSQIEELGHVVHIARTLDQITLKINELIQIVEVNLEKLIAVARDPEARKRGSASADYTATYGTTSTPPT